MTMPAKQKQHQHAAEDEGPGPPLEPVRHRKQRKRRGKLAEIERREGGADQVGPPGIGEMAGQKGVAAEIDAVDAAEQDADLPGQLVAPVGPPAGRLPAQLAPTALRAGASASVKIAISTSGRPQIASAHRQEPSTSGSTSGIVSMTGSVSPDEQAVGEDRGAEAHALRQPSAHKRRQRRLHDGDTRAHHNGGGIEHEHIEHGAAQTGGDARDQQTGRPASARRRSARSRAIPAAPRSPNRTIGRPERMPTSVPDRRRSA